MRAGIAGRAEEPFQVRKMEVTLRPAQLIQKFARGRK